MIKEFSKRVCVYIDGANFYGGLNALNYKFTDERFDFAKYIHKIVGKENLVKIYYYNGYSIVKDINN